MSDTTVNIETPDEPEVVVVETPETEQQEQAKPQEPRLSDRAEKRINTVLAQRKQAREELEQERRRRQELEARLATLERGQKESFKEVSTSRIEAAQRELREARLAGDTEAEVAAQSKLTEAHVRASQIPVETPQPRQAEQPQMPPVVRDWISRNDWYNTDKEMATAAQGFERAAVAAGLVMGTPEAFRYIDAKIRAVYADRLKMHETGDDGDEDEEEVVEVVPPTKSAPSSAAAPRRAMPGSAPTTARQVRLTPEQVRFAKEVFKISPQEYAAELYKIQKGKS